MRKMIVAGNHVRNPRNALYAEYIRAYFVLRSVLLDIICWYFVATKLSSAAYKTTIDQDCNTLASTCSFDHMGKVKDSKTTSKESRRQFSDKTEPLREKEISINSSDTSIANTYGSQTRNSTIGLPANPIVGFSPRASSIFASNSSAFDLAIEPRRGNVSNQAKHANAQPVFANFLDESYAKPRQEAVSVSPGAMVEKDYSLGDSVCDKNRKSAELSHFYQSGKMDAVECATKGLGFPWIMDPSIDNSSGFYSPSIGIPIMCLPTCDLSTMYSIPLCLSEYNQSAGAPSYMQSVELDENFTKYSPNRPQNMLNSCSFSEKTAAFDRQLVDLRPRSFETARESNVWLNGKSMINKTSQISEYQMSATDNGHFIPANCDIESLQIPTKWKTATHSNSYGGNVMEYHETANITTPLDLSMSCANVTEEYSSADYVTSPIRTGRYLESNSCNISQPVSPIANIYEENMRPNSMSVPSREQQVQASQESLKKFSEHSDACIRRESRSSSYETKDGDTEMRNSWLPLKKRKIASAESISNCSETITSNSDINLQNSDILSTDTVNTDDTAHYVDAEDYKRTSISSAASNSTTERLKPITLTDESLQVSTTSSLVQFDNPLILQAAQTQNHSSDFCLTSWYLADCNTGNDISTEMREITETTSSASTIHWTLKPDEDGDLPLHIAVAQDNIEAVKRIVQLMTKLGSTLDIYNNLRQTPLHLAVISNYKEVVDILLSGNACVNTVNRRGWNSIHLAVEMGDSELLPCLLKHCQHSAELETYSYEGYTPLHLASMASHTVLVETLLEAGANIDATDGKNGRTPLYFAAEKNDIQTVKVLLQRGANPEIASYSGCLPIQAASGMNHMSIVRLLEKFSNIKLLGLNASCNSKRTVR